MPLDLADFDARTREAVAFFWETRLAASARNAEVITRSVTLPGFFRPTKDWDVLVLRHGRLIAAVEFKSHIGPSFGNNANNRAEEAVGTAHDFWTAPREGVFGYKPRPFVGWVALVEDADGSRRPGVRETSRFFPVFPEFRNISYLDRYDILCRRLMAERLYTDAAVVASPRIEGLGGEYSNLSTATSLARFAASFAGHITAEAAFS